MFHLPRLHHLNYYKLFISIGDKTFVEVKNYPTERKSFRKHRKVSRPITKYRELSGTLEVHVSLVFSNVKNVQSDL